MGKLLVKQPMQTPYLPVSTVLMTPFREDKVKSVHI